MRKHFNPKKENETDYKNPNVKCKHCNSKSYIKQGFRKTQNRGKIQKYFCQNCKRNFTADLGFYRMRNNEIKITKAIDLYFSNLSSRKTRNHFYRHEKTIISHISILDWCRKYALKVHKYTSKFQPKLSGQYYADETMVDCEDRKDVFWCSVDWGTRFINATLYSPKRQNEKDATEFMQKVKKSGIPKYVQTDALPFYPQAFTSTFFKKKGKRIELPQHIVNNVHKTKKHNVRIEAVFMKLKDRIIDFRGLKALWSAPILIAGLVLQHNFIEEHTTLRDFPCERANLKFDVGVNRWLELIRLSSF